MKYQALAVVLCAMLGQSAFADDKVGPYVGVKVGTFMIDDVETAFGPVEMDDSNSIGVVGGYHFGSGFSAEVEYNSGEDFDVAGGAGQGSIDTLAVYAAFRIKPADGPFYFKGKVGFLSEDIEMTGPGGTDSGSDTGLSLGLGAGFDLGQNVMLEGEYTLIEQDVNQFSVGLNFKF